MGIVSHFVSLAHFLQAQHGFLKIAICLMAIPLIPLLLIGLQEDSASVRMRRLATCIASVLIFAYAAFYAATMAANIAFPPQWDFPISWLNGYVAAHGLNFYDPDNYRRLADALPATGDLSRFVISVGFHFPPPTIFLFLPLGFFDIHTAYLLWYGFMVGVLVLDIMLLARLFLGGTPSGMLLAAVLMLMLRPVMATVWFGQTNFLIVLMLLLFWQDRKAMRGGAWLALGVLIKPVFGFMILYAVMGRRWRALAGAALTLTVLSLLTVGVFGWETFASYFAHNPVTRMPTDVYTESMNQSLLAEILRLTHYDFSEGSPLMHRLFVVLAAGLIATTAFLTSHESGDDDLSLALTVPLALLVYPGTLAHYSVDLLVPLLAVWSRRRELMGGVVGAVAFFTIEYALLNAADSLAIAANAVAWSAVATLEVSRILRIDPAVRIAWGVRSPASDPSL